MNKLLPLLLAACLLPDFSSAQSTYGLPQKNDTVTKTSECGKTTGDFCFTNKTPQTVYVSIIDKNNEFNKYANTFKQPKQASNTLTIQPNSTECIYDFVPGTQEYIVGITVQNTYGLRTIKSGNILIEKCKSKSIEIK